MELSNLKPKRNSVFKAKRVGRGVGSGHGTTACRGYNGDRSRSGSKIKFAFEGGQMPFSRRLPKWGFTNKFRKTYQTVNISCLKEKIKDINKIDPHVLKTLGLIKNENSPVKILGDGELSSAITVSSHAFSKSAEKKIKAAGGAAEII